jgi:hypothetical protein
MKIIPGYRSQVEHLLKTHSADELTVEMYKFVQGRVDVSPKWGEHVEEMIFKELSILPNRAYPAVILLSIQVFFKGILSFLVALLTIFYVHVNMNRHMKLFLLLSSTKCGLHIHLALLMLSLVYTLYLLKIA